MIMTKRAYPFLGLALATPTFSVAQDQMPIADQLHAFVSTAERGLVDSEPGDMRAHYSWIMERSAALADDVSANTQVAAQEMALTYALASALQADEEAASAYLSVVASSRYVAASFADLSGQPLTRLQNVHYYARRAAAARRIGQQERMHARLTRQLRGLALAVH